MIRLFLTLAFLSLIPKLYAQNSVGFMQEVRPLLSNNCFHCHGPDHNDRQADLRLDKPGDIDFDEVLARITSDDPDLRMPPPESHKTLEQEEIELLKRWIHEGAPYEEHWAFAPPRLKEVPALKDKGWSQQDIDRFVLARLEQNDLQPNEQAHRRTLIRRVTLDLTGLPPTPGEIDGFLDDSSELAYENLVDRLLSTPQYGEHMARYWLDLVRFADTNGLHHDHYREMTPYRDWVIRSFNENLPFHDFIKFQIAGDLYDDPTDDQLIASGFNRLHLIIDRGTALPEESFVRNVVDRVTAVGTAFMGLTVQCAVCHDHKYDPITQKDFYQLYAFFNNFDGEPETGFRGGLDFKRGLQPPYLELPSPEQESRLAELDKQIEELIDEINQWKTAKNEGETTADVEDKELQPSKEALEVSLKRARDERSELIQSVPATLVMKEREKVRPAHILVRGVYDQHGEEVQRNTPAFLPPMKPSDDLKTRMDLARWLTEPSHPLTARVAVNRFWQQFFGIGLTRTSEDFGAQGEPPSHPELLDYLAVSFVESDWDVKALVRKIVLSKTYQQSSKASPKLFANDPDNRLLARGARFRLDAEVIRDQLLAVTGLLNTQQFGRSVKPPQPPGLWKIVVMPGSYPREYEPDEGDRIFRRSIYTFWRRSLPPPQMTILDAPTRESCIARRERTNTPLQALLLMNEQEYFRAAMHYANDLLHETNLSDQQRLQQAYERITAQLPDQATLSQLENTLGRFRKLYHDHPADAAAMIFATQVIQTDDEQVSAELASWTMLVHTLLNLDTTKTHE